MELLSLREKHEYEAEIDQLKAKAELLADKLIKSNYSKNNYRKQLEKLTGKKVTKVGRARLMIVDSKKKGFNGNISAECERIGDILNMGAANVRSLWYSKTTENNNV